LEDNVQIIIDDSKVIGLNIVIVNDGYATLKNVKLSIDISGGFIIKLSKEEYEIPDILPGNSKKIHVNLFGIGIGLFTQIPIINITLYSESAYHNERFIAKIVGPLIKLVSVTKLSPKAYNGYTLFSPEFSYDTYLINNKGDNLHTWKGLFPQVMATYLLENGNFIKSDLSKLNTVFQGGGVTGHVEILDWNSKLLWEFEYSNKTVCLHHDVEYLPNGNILMIAWEYKSIDDMINAGRNHMGFFGNCLWPDHIIEVEQTDMTWGTIVWEWHVWDHLIQDYDPLKENYGTVRDQPELIDINFGNDISDWNHINSIDYNEDLDQILLSVISSTDENLSLSFK